MDDLKLYSPKSEKNRNADEKSENKFRLHLNGIWNWQVCLRTIKKKTYLPISNSKRSRH